MESAAGAGLVGGTGAGRGPGACGDSGPVADSTRTPVAEHARVSDGPEPERAAQQVPEQEDPEPVTAKGLPKRTPKITAPVEAPRQRNGPVDAEALRRRLGGFRRWAEAGR
ncbi:hypothetical protein, partial [Streptomyces prasinus]|uniref:hypothetical protein n=1 Tax=Streptomyces prasinus TaxID=67345 RepID=UPI000A52981C